MKLGLALSHDSGLWRQVLEQEKVPFCILGDSAEAPDPAIWPVAVLSGAAGGSRAAAWKRYLAGGGGLVATQKTAREAGLSADERLQVVEDSELYSDSHGRVCLKNFLWDESGEFVSENVACYPAGRWRREVVARIKAVFWSKGLPYVRLSHYPAPYRSLFSFRLDFDHHIAADFEAVRSLLRDFPGIATCFLNMKSYESCPDAVKRLADDGAAIGSHGYIHHVYDRYEQNRWNVDRAGELLKKSGVSIKAFSGPHGLWHPSLQRALEEAGYVYSSEFALNYDDFPFFPLVGGRKSAVLQVPVHPVCEGVFFERYGLETPLLSRYFETVLREKVEAGEPVIFFGHPDGRIGARPEVFRGLMARASADSSLWKADLHVWSDWWIKRQAWNFEAEGESEFKVTLASAGPEAVVEYHWPDSVERRAAGEFLKPVTRRKPFTEAVILKPSALRESVPAVSPLQKAKKAVKRYLDWETKTPVQSYIGSGLRHQARLALRQAHDRWRGPAGQADVWRVPDPARKGKGGC